MSKEKLTKIDLQRKADWTAIIKQASGKRVIGELLNMSDYFKVNNHSETAMALRQEGRQAIGLHIYATLIRFCRTEFINLINEFDRQAEIRKADQIQQNKDKEDL
jgi:hypothetical protein